MDKLVGRVVQGYKKSTAVSAEAKRAFDLELRKELADDMSHTRRVLAAAS